MKKIYALLFATLFASAVSAQVFTSDFETWASGVPSGWVGVKTSFAADSIIQYTTNPHGGTSACKLQSATSSHKRLTTTALTITSGQSYSISFWVRGHGEIRSGLWNGGPSGNDYFYNSYIVVNSSSWTQYTQTVTADTNSVNAEFIFSVRNSVADLDHIQIDDVNITLASTPTVTIHDIQYTTAGTGDSPYNNQVVNTRGVVTGKYSGGYWLQYGNGAWNGVYVYDNVNACTRGDSVSLTALVTEYFNLTELKNVTNFTLISSGNTLPTPAVITTTQSNTEDYEGVLVQVLDVTAVDTVGLQSYGYWNGKNGADTAHFDNLMNFFSPTLNAHYNVTGIVQYVYSKYRIEPRDAADIVLISGIGEMENGSWKIYPNPTSGVVNVSSERLLSNIRITDLTGRVVLDQNLNAGNAQLNVEGLMQGLYLIRLTGEDGTTGTGRIVIE